MAFEDLTDEQREMARGKSPQELLELSKKIGRKLTDEEVEQIAGGSGWQAGTCPSCGSDNTTATSVGGAPLSQCNACGHTWM